MAKLTHLLAMACLFASPVVAQPVSIVAAENFYGDVAQQVARPSATVSSIMSNPDQDPHLFEASPSVAGLLSGAPSRSTMAWITIRG